MKKTQPEPSGQQTVKQKTNWQLARSLMGSHYVAVIFCLIISMGFLSAFNGNITAMVIIGIATFVVYTLFMYAPSWKFGNDDLNKVKFGRRKEDKLRGFKLGLLTMVPNIVLTVLILLAKAELLPNFYVIYKLLNGHLMVIANLIDQTAAGVLTAYLTEMQWGRLIIVCIMNCAVTPIICGISYLLGYKNLLVADKLIYKKKK